MIVLGRGIDNSVFSFNETDCKNICFICRNKYLVTLNVMNIVGALGNVKVGVFTRIINKFWWGEDSNVSIISSRKQLVAEDFDVVILDGWSNIPLDDIKAVLDKQKTRVILLYPKFDSSVQQIAEYFDVFIIGAVGKGDVKYEEKLDQLNICKDYFGVDCLSSIMPAIMDSSRIYAVNIKGSWSNIFLGIEKGV